jgi:hypothetical protein
VWAVRVGRLHRSEQALADLPAFSFDAVGAQDATEPAVRFAVAQQLANAAFMFATGVVFVAISVGAGFDPSFADIAWGALFVAVGLVAVVLAIGAARDALRRRREYALARDGLLLVGRDLDEPFPVRGTTYELQDDNGDRFVVLRHRGREQRLAANHWRATAGMTLDEALAALTGPPSAGFYAE